LKSNGEDDSFKKRDLKELKHMNGHDNEEIDIKFNVGFGEDIGKKFLEEKAEKKDKESESAWTKY